MGFSRDGGVTNGPRPGEETPVKVLYRGHEIEAKREKCLAGYTLLYWSVFRAADGYECASGYSDTDDTARTMVECLKRRVDAELAEADPWDEAAMYGGSDEQQLPAGV